MFTLIQRYVFRELAIPALLGLVAYTAILVVQRFFVLADQWVAGVLSAGDVGLSLTYFLPSVLVQTIPMAVLLGILIGFARLSSDSEITALRATGVSYFRLLVPTSYLAGIGWVLSAAVYLQAVPWSNARYVELGLRASQRVDMNREITAGTWLLLDGAAMFARGIDASNPAEPWLLDVDVVFSRPGQPRRERWRAERARIERLATKEGTGRLRIEALGLRTVAWKPGDASETPLLTRQDRREWFGEERPLPGAQRQTTSLTRRIYLDARVKRLGELRRTLSQIREMERIDGELEASDPKAAAREREAMGLDWVSAERRPTLARITRMELHKKFAIPVACIAFALCGLPLGVATRRGGWQAAFVVSIGIVALWFVLYQWAEAWMKAGELSPGLAAWLPDIVLGTIGLYLLFRQRRQQRVGVYRIVRDAALLCTLSTSLITALLLVDRVTHDGGTGRFPTWPPIAAGAFLAASVLILLFRDPVARSLAAVTDELRRHTARQAPMEGAPEGPRPEEPPDGTAPDDAPDLAGHRRLVRRLEDVRSGVAFVFLAVVAVAAYQVVSDESGIAAGFRRLVTDWLGLLLLVIGAGLVALQASGARVVKTLDWWVLTAYAKVLVLILASLVLLALLFQYVDLATEILQNRIPVPRVVELYVNQMPEILVWTVPMATMVACLVVFSLVGKNNEATAVRCGGVSLFRLALPVVLASLFLSFVTFLIHDYLLPKASQQALAIREEIRGRAPRPMGFARGFLLAEDGRALYVSDRSIVSDQGRDVQLHGLSVLRMDEAGDARELVVARTAQWLGDAWRLDDGWTARIAASGEVEQSRFASERRTDMEAPDYFTTSLDRPDQMSFADFRRFIDEQEAAGYPVARERVLLQRKIAFPLSCLVLVLVGLPFAFTAGRRGALHGVGLAFVLYLVYYAALAIFTALGAAGYIPATVAAWAPNGLFLIGGVFLLLHVRT